MQLDNDMLHRAQESLEIIQDEMVRKDQALAQEKLEHEETRRELALALIEIDQLKGRTDV